MAESWAALVRECWEADRLLTVLLELGYQCPLRCVFCYNDRGRRGEYLSRQRYETLLHEMAEMGVLSLTFSGGEPTVHPDFFPLGRLAKALGFVVRIKTAGSHLDAGTIRRIVEEIEPFVVELSLHGASAATHERQTRIGGSFDGLMEAVRLFREAGQRLELRTVLTRWNEEELDDLFALADDLGVPIRIDPSVSPRDDGDRSPVALAASGDAIRRLFMLEMERSGAQAPVGDRSTGCGLGDGRRYCGAGTGTAVIDPFGDVLPCVEWRRPVGNVRSHSLREIWRCSAELAAVRAENEAAARAVMGQPMAGALAFCPARALEETGRPDRLTDGSLHRRRLVLEVFEEHRRRRPVIEGEAGR